MKFGLQIYSFTWPGGPEAIGPTIARTVQTADDVGRLRQPDEHQGGRGERRGIPLLAEDEDLGLLRHPGQAGGAGGVQPPLEDVALDDHGP